MASLSFRDRFFSPPVSRAVTSPSAILALGVGAAVGVVATAPLSIPLAVLGAVVGGAVGYGGRVALAMPKKGKGIRIDPFALTDPWRRAVQEAVRSQARFDDAVRSFRKGPLLDTMTTVSGQIEEAISECWQVAQQGQLLADARKRINDREAQWELKQTTDAMAGNPPNATQASTISALQSQLQSAGRLDALVARTRDELALLNARLDESVTKAIELSVSNRLEDADALGEDMDDIVEDLESLRLAIEDVDGAGAGTTGAPDVATPGAEPAGPAPAAGAPHLPPPPARDPLTPPPLPSAGEAGQSQASPGS
ncbi:hypothetical protein KSP35_07925 [Aquihabitans sp. G128]|uniref:hypothetical protein n=1 Tax=Aquihabitans sp. G128 TaxID=2849779 RepID=UPI001C2492FF|nr:hypothetical protein [Aquihabitans sp. G128]QXC62709.1 hypothetical protein KSP35_07925 [Aquihabitans sp. G128]